MSKVTTKEFIWYAICGLVATLGLICIIFGIVGDHMGVPASENFVTVFEDKIHFELRYIGLIAIAVAVIVFIICLLVNAKKADREVEKKLRRELRVAAQSNATIEVKKAVEVIEEKPAEEAK